jgi:fibronectin type 3 domain-containing protein
MIEVRGTSRQAGLEVGGQKSFASDLKRSGPQPSSEALGPYQVQGEALGQEFRKARLNMMNKKIVILFLLTLLLASACGKKASPVPWESIAPRRIVDLVAIPREGRLLLEWTAPKENTDKSSLLDLEGFQVLRSEGLLIGDQCRDCGEKPKLVYEMKLDGKGEERGKKVSIFIEDQEPGKAYVYQVISVNRRGHPSSPSNPVWVYWDSPPAPPEKVTGEQGDKRVDLSWEPVEGATGYNLYRRGEEGSFSTRPLNKAPLPETKYTDLSVENEKRYIYSIRTLRRVVKTDVEGRDSQEVAVTPTDLIPPGSPMGLAAFPLKNGMELNWRKNPEPDLLGYHVYRRKQGEKEFKRLTESPLAKETYLDLDVELGQDYEYAVTAVDHSVRKNESPLSEEVRVKYLF